MTSAARLLNQSPCQVPSLVPYRQIAGVAGHIIANELGPTSSTKGGPDRMLSPGAQVASSVISHNNLSTLFQLLVDRNKVDPVWL